MTIEKDLKTLRENCFKIEEQLPLFDAFGENDIAQNLRRALYRVRIELGDLLCVAKLVDSKLGLGDYVTDVYQESSKPEFEDQPTAWISGKVIHQFADLAGGYEPLYRKVQK